MAPTTVRLRCIGRDVVLPIAGAARAAVASYTPSFEGHATGLARRAIAKLLPARAKGAALEAAQRRLEIVRQVRPLLESLAKSYERQFYRCEAALLEGQAASCEREYAQEKALLTAIARVEDGAACRLLAHGYRRRLERFEELLAGTVGWISTARFSTYWKALERHLVHHVRWLS